MKKQHIKKTNNNGVLPKRKLLKKLLVTTGLLLGFNYGLMAQNTAYGTAALGSVTTGIQNSAFGFYALNSNTTGHNNTATGTHALSKNTSGHGNTANGYQVLFYNTDGGSNTGNGYMALFLNTTGYSNTANGTKALYSNTTGNWNTANGVYALYSDSIGSYNTANGYQALYYNKTGTYNAAFGVNALLNTTGSYNAALGYNADVAAGFNNSTAIGANAKATASNTIQLGDNTVTKVYAGVDKTATLIAGGLQITGGTPAVGKVLTSDANGLATWQNPMGGGTGWGLTGNLGTVDGTNFIGTTDNIPFNIRVNNQKAGRIDANNAFYGYQSGNARTTGGYNTANGYQALYANTTGDGNTAIGDRSLLANTIGNYNTAVGSLTLSSNVEGKYNTALGYAADVNIGLNNATAIGSGAKATVSNTIQLGDVAITKVFAGVGNTAILVAGGLQVTGGMPAVGKVLTSDATGVATWQLPNTGSDWSLIGNTGTIDGVNFIGTTDNVPFNIRVNNQKAGRIDPTLYNAFYGYQSGNAITTGEHNTANGNNALCANTTGDGNTSVGDEALYSNTTGSYNTAVGNSALNNNITGKRNTTLGYYSNVSDPNLSNATAIGAHAIVNAKNKVRLGDPAVTVVEIAATAVYTGSDGRFKTNISESDIKGLEFIQKLRPVVYNFDTKKFQAFLTQNMPADVRKEYMNKDFSASTAIRQSGFIAQEVEKAAQEVGYDFNGIHKPESANDNYSLAYSQFVVPLVKAVQELDKKDEQKDKQIERLQKEKEQQKKINEQLQQQIDELKKLIAGNTNSTKELITKVVPNTESEDINLYPNPTTGIFTITASNIDNGLIEIYDMAGNSLQKTTFNNGKTGYQLNVSGYAKGVYLLNVIANNKKYIKRLVIQ